MSSNLYPSYQVYLAWNNTHYRIFISHWPELDLKILFQEQGLNKLGLLTRPLPIGIAHYVAGWIASETERRLALLASADQTSFPGVKAGGWRSWLIRGQERLRRLTRTTDSANTTEFGNLLMPEKNGRAEFGPALLHQRFRLVQKALKSLEAGALPEKLAWAEFKPRILVVGDSGYAASGAGPCFSVDPAGSESLGEQKVLKASNALEDAGEAPLLSAYEPGSVKSIQINQVSAASDAFAAAAVPGTKAILSEILAGRVLVAGEVKTMLATKGLISEAVPGPWLPLSIQNILQVLALRGEVCLLPSVNRSQLGDPVCQRCGQSRGIKSSVCHYCGRLACYYCEECLNLGLARECLPLIAMPGQSRLTGLPETIPTPQALSHAHQGLRHSSPASPLAPQTSRYSPPGPHLTPRGSRYSEIQAPYQTPPVSGPIPDVSAQSQEISQEEGDRKTTGIPAPVCLEFALTPAQQRAAEEVRQFWLSGKQAECLVWAVCGAGKTEVVFSVLAEVLARGGRVLYAIPRRDVVRELEPRLRQAFPNYRVLGLYAGSGRRYAAADIYVATTHQSLRFYQNFDLVILDEVDAYPYRDSPMLHFAVQRARKPEGKTVYLTATPKSAMQQLALKGEMGLVYIPARHHGYPVPEPELLAERQLRYPRTGQELGLPQTVIELIYQSVVVEQVRLFVFVPSIWLTEQVARAINRVVESDDRFENKRARNWAQFCHARDPWRDQKRTGFSRGNFPILVTTTILERGITIAPVNVLVLFAESEKIFDEGTLVQMAGRTGRTEAYPEGKVWLVGASVSPAMRQARDRILEMNRIARDRGYLRG
jgi:late competence protein required for DNA uptake (superfamily II DNA/RNA helicase)